MSLILVCFYLLSCALECSSFLLQNILSTHPMDQYEVAWTRQVLMHTTQLALVGLHWPIMHVRTHLGVEVVKEGCLR